MTVEGRPNILGTAKMKRVEGKGDMKSVRGCFLEEAFFIL